MSEMIEKFGILRKLDKKEKESIKLFYIFNNLSEKHPYDINGTNVIIVTDKDETKVMGNNSNGCLGLTEKRVSTLMRVSQLTGKNLISFSNGSYHVIACSKNNNIYCWGYNNLGQLGRGTDGNLSYTPERNAFLSSKCIVDVKCGDWHSLALTSTGEVYAWGDNKFGQIGNGSSRTLESTPVKLAFQGHLIIAISCGSLHSIALTEKGSVFTWGFNNNGQLGLGNTRDLSKPKLIEREWNISKIVCGQIHSLLLTTDGCLYVCGKTYLNYRGSKKIPTSINYNEHQFTDIASNISYQFSVVQSKDDKCFRFGKFGTEKISSISSTPYKSIVDYYAEKYNITVGTIVIKEDIDQFSDMNESKYSRFESSVHEKDISYSTNKSIGSNISNESRYFNDFEEIECVGRGGFGSVYKVKNKLDDRFYAIKKVNFEGMPAQDKEFCHKELKLLAKIESEFVVRYITSWKESENFLFIQMELCSSTLKEVIFKKKQEFNRNGREAMNITEFYISNELFKEIVEGINYLHNLETPIIHRDLKPQNLLITSGINGRFIKIADFGLATFHDSNEQSHTKNMGTVKYCALEVQNGRNYNTKADIYSLGVLAQDLFDVDIYSLSGLTVFENLIFKSKFECLVKWIIAMNSTQSGMRPSCSKLIENMNSWTLSRDELESDPEFEKFRDLSQDIESIERNFIQYYFTKTWMKTSKEELTHL